MNYKVLYRKYRPNDFENLVGQEYTSKILRNSIINNKIAHAYIFAGPRGTGKTSTAKIFAKSVNCLNPIDGEACGKCDNCLNFDTSTDIIEIDAASNNGVDQIREITNNVKLSPSMYKYKVYIIDEVHMLSQSAFNALLLTLEEPPSHVIFILATTNIENVPITIISRCQRYDFKKISNEEIINRMKYICDQEKIEYDEEGLAEIAFIADGGLRDALSLLDQISKNGIKISQELVIKEAGSVSLKNIEDLVENLELNKCQEIIKQIEEYRNMSLDYKLIVKKIISTCLKNTRNIVENSYQQRLSVDEYKKLVMELTDCLNKMNINVDPYLLIEMIILSYMKNNPNLENNTDKNISREIIETKNSNKSDENFKNISREIFLESESKGKIKIHNCLAMANKQEKNLLTKKWKSFIDETDNLSIKNNIIDSVVAVASEKIFIICVDLQASVSELLENIVNIKEEFNKMNDSEYDIWVITNSEWRSISKKYIEDIKNGIKYEIMDEIEENNDELEKLANNVFSTDKIEIK